MTDTTRLLILDDDPLTGQTILNIARSSDVDALYTDDPLEFFRLVQEWQPHFIALDLVMPRMDGVQVMVELARLQCRAHIIISSGVGGRILDAAARSAAEHGLNITGVLAKPFSPARLRQLLGRSPSGQSAEKHIPANATQATDPGQTDLLVKDLALAIEQNRITLAYQPKINCRTGLLAGFEALARWHHPTLGSVSPELFIPLAEQHGLIDALTESVMRQSLRWLSNLPLQFENQQGSDYLRRRLQEVTLSINLSAGSLNNLDIFERLDDFSKSLGILPERLIFELTETCAMEDPVSSLDILTRLRMKGFHLSIDDFGTGYSSMLQLARLPFSEIKIDRSFVSTAAESKESRTVIKAIIDLGHGLGLYTSAEGIESPGALEYLRSIGCDLAQGYAIARPMDEAEVLAWIMSNHKDDETHRIQVLHSLNLLDTPPDERFDRITRLAARLFRVPVSLLSLVDTDRQWFKSAYGLSLKETPRDISLCSLAIQDNEILMIEDAQADPAFNGNPLVTQDPFIRFYAGCPVHAGTGSRLGTLCLIDHQPRTLNAQEQNLLRHTARMIENELAADYVAHIDALTGMLNRRGFDARARETIELCRDAGLQASLLLFDLIEFKAFNENHGPAAGDRALSDFGQLLRDTFRGSDLMARYGDDDFVVLLINTHDANPQIALDRLYDAAASTPRSPRITYTAGWSVLDPHSGNLQQLILQASQQMHLERRHHQY